MCVFLLKLFLLNAVTCFCFTHNANNLLSRQQRYPERLSRDNSFIFQSLHSNHVLGGDGKHV